MKLALAFPGGEAFAPGMGRELFEHFAPMQAAAQVHREVTGTDLARSLFHPLGDVTLDEDDQLLAVVTVGVGFFRVLQERIPMVGDVFVGRGVGRLAALVAAGRLEHAAALELVTSGPARDAELGTSPGVVVGLDGQPVGAAALNAGRGSGWTSEPVDPAAVSDLVAAHGIDTVLEVGPGGGLALELRAVVGVDVVVAALDDSRNAQMVLDTLSVPKYLNLQFLAERTLGQVVGTRNHRPGTEGQEAVRDLAAKIKAVASSGLATDPGQPLRQEAGDVVSTLCDAWVTNGAVKGHAPEDILESLRVLERTTLVPVRRLAGADLDSIRARCEELSHAN